MVKEKMISIAILGAGNMGTALAQILALRGRRVCIWDYNPGTVAEIKHTGMNKQFLPGVKLSRRITVESDMKRAVAGVQLIIVACASSYVRETVRQLGRCFDIAPTLPNLPSGRGGNRFVSPPYRGGVRGGAIVAHVAKGLEDKTFLTMHEVVQSELPSSLRRRVVTISGPSIAKEFVRGVPTAVVGASQDIRAAEFVRSAFEYTKALPPSRRRQGLPTLRLEISADWKGVGLCGALKNVYAIALGMCDGMQLTMNAKAFMFTYAVQEMGKIVSVLGGKQETVKGLAGIGDLVVTGLGDGRNRALGERICKEGLPVQAGHCKFLWNKNTGTVEGVTAVRVFYKLCRRQKISAPIVKMVYQVLHRGMDPCKEVKNFFARVKIDDRQ